MGYMNPRFVSKDELRRRIAELEAEVERIRAEVEKMLPTGIHDCSMETSIRVGVKRRTIEAVLALFDSLPRWKERT